MKNKKKILYSSLIIIILIAINNTCYGQVKDYAIKVITEKFSNCFVKTPVYLISSKEKLAYTYDYEIRSRFLLFKIIQEGSSVKTTWVKVPYDAITGITLGEKSFHFKKQTHLNFFTHEKFEVSYSDIYNETGPFGTTDAVAIPFNYINYSTYVQIDSALINLKKENILEDKLLKEKLILTNKIETFDLHILDFFTKDSVNINLHNYLKNGRKFNSKPTLIVTFSNLWCRPCLMNIDSILHNGLGKNYNVILINRDTRSQFSKVKNMITEKVPDYNIDAIVLFDLNDQLKSIESGAPSYFILNNNLDLVYYHAGYDIKIPELKVSLQKF